jgi:hypothetical protein
MLKTVSDTTADRHGARAADNSEPAALCLFVITSTSAANHPAEALPDI